MLISQPPELSLLDKLNLRHKEEIAIISKVYYPAMTHTQKY